MFFAGHGLGLSDGSYLLPSDVTPAALEADFTARRAAIREAEWTDELQNSGARVVIVVIDACRNDIFSRGMTRGVERGLRPAPTEGVFKLYSASEGQSAMDRLPGADPSKNSVFTRVFLKALENPRLDLNRLGAEVRDEVFELASGAHHEQIPAVYDKLVGSSRVFLGASGEAGAASPPQIVALSPVVPPATKPAPDEAAWSMIQRPSDSSLIANFMARFPTSASHGTAQNAMEELKRQQMAALPPSQPIKVSVDESTKPAAPPPIVPPAVGLRPPAKTSWRLPEGATIEARDACYYNSHINSIVFSPDGRLALSGGDEKTLRLWNLETGKEVNRFKGHEMGVTSIAISPDGHSALSASRDGTLRLWDIALGKEIRRLAGHKGSVDSAVFSPDGRFVLSGSYDNSIRLWDIQTGKEIRRFPGHNSYVTSVAFSPDGRLFLSGGDDNILRLHDVANRKVIRQFALQVGTTSSVGFSPDGRFALSSSNESLWRRGDAALHLWDITTGQEIRRFVGSVGEVSFSPDGRAYLMGGSVPHLWELATGKEIRGFTRSMGAVAFSPDGRFFLSGGRDLRLWDTATGTWRIAFIAKTSCENDSSQGWAAFTPDGLYVGEGDVAKILKIVRREGDKDLELPMDDFIAVNRRDSLADAISRTSAVK